MTKVVAFSTSDCSTLSDLMVRRLANKAVGSLTRVNDAAVRPIEMEVGICTSCPFESFLILILYFRIPYHIPNLSRGLVV